MKTLLHTTLVVSSHCLHVGVPQQGAKELHIEEDITGVFHLYILQPKNAAETIINVARDNITKISLSVFPNITQYTYDSFVACTKTPQRVLDNETSVTHVDKNRWRYH